MKTGEKLKVDTGFSRLADRVLSAFHGGKEETRRGDFGGALGALGEIISGDS